MRIELSSIVNPDSVDSDNGVIRGVSVITVGEAKGHPVAIDAKTLETVMQRAKEFPAGLKVKANHVDDALAIIGYIKDFRIEGLQLKGDLYLLKESPNYSQVEELVRTLPDQIGLSISFQFVTETIGEVEFARCTRIFSCDLVDSPAANPSGLFSSKEIMSESVAAPVAETKVETVVAPVVALSDTAASDANTSLKDVVDQLIARVNALEVAAQADAEYDLSKDKQVENEEDDADMSAKFAIVQDQTKALLSIVDKLKWELSALKKDSKATFEVASEIVAELGEVAVVPTTAAIESQVGNPEKLADFKVLEASKGLDRVKLSRRFEAKHGKNWIAEFRK